MTLEYFDYGIVIGATVILTTASTTIITMKLNDKLREKICNQMTDLLIRVGILEEKHRNPD